MFGIPWTPMNHDQFFISLYAGLLANIVTAIIGGLILWFIISQIEKRRLYRQYEREVAEFRQKLLYALDKFNVAFLGAIAAPPSAAGILGGYLQTYPINIWKENLPKQKQFFASIEAFQHAYSEFTVIANKLQTIIQIGIRYFNTNQSQLSQSSLDATTLEQYLSGRILGEENKQQLLILIGYNEKTLSIFEKAEREILSQEVLQKYQIPYRDLRTKLSEAVDNVKKLL